MIAINVHMDSSTELYIIQLLKPSIKKTLEQSELDIYDRRKYFNLNASAVSILKKFNAQMWLLLLLSTSMSVVICVVVGAVIGIGIEIAVGVDFDVCVSVGFVVSVTFCINEAKLCWTFGTGFRPVDLRFPPELWLFCKLKVNI